MLSHKEEKGKKRRREENKSTIHACTNYLRHPYFVHTDLLCFPWVANLGEGRLADAVACLSNSYPLSSLLFK